MYKILSDKEEWIAKQVVNIAIKIHKQLGPGLLESIYAKCFYYALEKRNIPYQKEQLVPIKYDDVIFDNSLRLDCIVENLVIIEFKAQENSHPIWEAKLLSYLRLTEKRLGFLINFHVSLMKQGIKRLIL